MGKQKESDVENISQQVVKKESSTEYNIPEFIGMLNEDKELYRKKSEKLQKNLDKCKKEFQKKIDQYKGEFRKELDQCKEQINKLQTENIVLKIKLKELNFFDCVNLAGLLILAGLGAMNQYFIDTIGQKWYNAVFVVACTLGIIYLLYRLTQRKE